MGAGGLGGLERAWRAPCLALGAWCLVFAFFYEVLRVRSLCVVFGPHHCVTVMCQPGPTGGATFLPHQCWASWLWFAFHRVVP